LRFVRPTIPKPLAIVAPIDDSHVIATVLCTKLTGLELRIRSGGHDYECLSSWSPSPFVILDMHNLLSIDIDLPSETARVGSRATLGELYYAIAKKSKTLAFPAGVWPSVGIGGHIVGGGSGNLTRKYVIAVDNVLDTCVVGRSWQLVSTNLTRDLFIRAMPQVVAGKGGKNEVEISFIGQYLGRLKKIVSLLDESFPELGFKATDGAEGSWVESVLPWAELPAGPLEVLLSREAKHQSFQSKSDYVKEAIPKEALPQIWEALLKTGVAWM
ncbi:Berberine bridge enzyme-like 5, partial [Linum grandiflorum]